MEAIRCLVCGMNINENNYDFNSHAFLQKNTETDIIYCPFCGAGREFLSRTGEVYILDEAKLDEKTITILDHAMKLEVFNGDFYNKASKMVQSNSIRLMLEALSKIELMHARTHQRIGGFKELPRLAEVNYDKFTSEDELLYQANLREKHAVQYYNKYYNEVSDDNIRKIFDALSEVEKEHIILTNK
ncbi:MAG: ferritin-like domain-containing protein [Bacillota bacterium]|nr:ferritin-like domain-containing protein [Bacillota bacterium]